MTSVSVDINGWPIYYEKFGTGAEIILLIPGAIGTGRTDFLPQLEGPHALHQQKYTLIAIELPGWGRSRPAERGFREYVYLNDADIALKLMDSLGFSDGFSIIAWSYGAKVALIIAMKNLPQIKCVVSMSASLKWTLDPNEHKPLLCSLNTYNWPKEFRDNYLAVYTDVEIQMLWSTHFETSVQLRLKYPNGYWTEELESIRCPVLILHGDMDKICTLENALNIEKNVMNSVLHRFRCGGHNFHHKYPAEFKTVVEHFVDNIVIRAML